MAAKPRISVSLREQDYGHTPARAEKYRIFLARVGRQTTMVPFGRYSDRQLKPPVAMPYAKCF